MRKKSLLAAVVCAAAVSGLNVNAAHAQGQVERGTDHARSICSFSGLNDDPEAEAPEGGRVQSYGQLVRQGLKSEFPSPGAACNGHLNPIK